MKKLLLTILFSLTIIPMIAKRHDATTWVNSGNPQLDTLLVQLNRCARWNDKIGIGKLDAFVHINGTSFSENHRWWSSLAHDILPFDARVNDTTYLEALSKASYQTPCDLLIHPITLSSDNRRRSRRILNELNPLLLPIYDMHVMRERGNDKNYVIPFSDDGLRQYHYQVSDTSLVGRDTILAISFAPKKPHHGLLEGLAMVNLRFLSITEMQVCGKIDFGKFSDTLRFEMTDNGPILKSSSVGLDYKYGKMRGHNHFNYELDYVQILPAQAFDPRTEPLNLTEIYQTHPSYFKKSDDTRPANPSEKTEKKYYAFFNRLPKLMVSASNFDAFGTDVRIYGPLNPSFIGYDKINGITFRQCMRFNKLFQNGQSIQIRPEAGYSCRLKELRYRFNLDWTYCPERRAAFLLRLRNGANGFSSRFKDDVNQTIKNYAQNLAHKNATNQQSKLNFDSLGLQFFRSYEFALENALELAPGLMFYLGANYTIRRPVTHGAYASSAIKDVSIQEHYYDLNPYFRLVYTPRQYYYYEGRQKLYLRSQWPTFSFETGKGLKNVLNSRANYLRMELDAQQFYPLGNNRNIYWRFGGGGFFKQKEEYFVNYTYFSRSQYPSTWGRSSIGGKFTLLDDYWYSSSPSYLQAHVMYETPFMLLHQWHQISKYIIKERIYCSSLIAHSKNVYGELGYGIGNNYFNISVFCGFMGKKPFDIGAKFSIELDKHL